MTGDVTLQTALTQQAQTTASEQSLASDFNEFLILLTTQLQNQDPLSPIESTEFTSQLVQFAGVEQQVNANQKLDSLVALNLGQSSSASLGYVGKEVTYVSSEFDYSGSPAKIRYSLNRAAEDTTIRILNEDGIEVYKQDVNANPGANDFTWNGQVTGGGAAPSGTYTVVVDALDGNGKAIQSQTVVEGKVRGVETQNGQTFLLVGDRAIALANVLNAKDAGSGNNNNGDALTLALSYIGLEARYNNSRVVYRGEDEVPINYNIAEDADRAKVLIFDSTGNIVRSDNIDPSEGDGTYVWDGLNNNGQRVRNADYTVVIDALKQDRVPVREGDVTYSGEAVSLTYTLQNDADNVEIEIRDSNGNIIFTDDNIGNDGGQNTFTWDGSLNDGGTAENGTYEFVIRTVSNDDRPVETSTISRGIVEGVEQNNGQIFLTINGRAIALSNITSVNLAPPGDDTPQG